MKKMAKVFLTLLMMVTLMISSSLAFAEGENPEVTLSFLIQKTEDSAESKTYKKIAEMYKAEVNPNFNFEPEYISDSASYYQKLKILIASNEMPDWFQADPDAFTAELREAGLIYNVCDMLEELGLTDRFLSITLNYPRFSDGELYGMAIGANTEWFWYHPSMFEAAGVEAPTTWAEFFEVCEALRAHGMTPVAAPPRMAMMLRSAAFIPFRMYGNDWIEGAISGKLSWGTDAGIAMGEFMQKYATYFNEGWSGMDSSAMRDLFLSKGASMWYESTGQCLQYLTDENQELLDDIAWFKLPLLDGYDATDETMYFANSGKAIFMSKAFVEENKEEIYRFVEYFINHFGDIYLYEYNTCSGIMPSNMDNLSNLYKELYKEFNAVTEYAACWDVIIDPVSNEVLKGEIYNLTLGEITPQEFAEIMDQAIEENVK